MKKTLFFIFSLMLVASIAMSQESSGTVVPLIGQEAPSFTAESTNGTINFPKDFGKDWKIIFSHPADFTPVCSSELLELAALQADFKKMNVDLIVVSTDNLESHKNWIKSLESLNYKNRQTAKIEFPLVDDQSKAIAKKYGMIHPNNNSTKDVRGVFIVDPKNTIRAMFFYPMNIGRNMDEIKRTLLAFQTSEKDNVLTPADWQPGGDVLLPYVKKDNEKGNATSANDPQVYQLTWYMIFKKM